MNGANWFDLLFHLINRAQWTITCAVTLWFYSYTVHIVIGSVRVTRKICYLTSKNVCVTCRNRRVNVSWAFHSWT